MKNFLSFLILFIFFATAGNAQVAGDNFFKSGQEKDLAEDIDGAIVDYTKAIQANPKHINAYLRRGFAYVRTEKYKEAVEDFTKVIEMEPKHAQSYLTRGSAYNKLNEFQKALADFNQVITLDPKNQEAYNNRGWAKKGLGDQEGACNDWRTSKKMGNAEAKIILNNSNCK